MKSKNNMPARGGSSPEASAPLEHAFGGKLIVGLGNPGERYSNTWHNAGFIIVDQLQTSKPEEFSDFKNSKKHKALVCEGTNPIEKTILAKPDTFMNNSGQAVKSLVNFYKIAPENVWVIHDDIDLPLGKIRISKNSSAGGHKGIQSIIDELGTQEFARFRIGIQSERQGKITTEKYVLQKISKEDNICIDDVGQKALSAIEVALANGISEAMNEFN